MKTGSVVTTILAVFAVITISLSGYIAGYLWLGTCNDWRNNPNDGPYGMIERNYQQLWLATVFEPAGRVEGLLRGSQVYVTYSELPGPATIQEP